MVTRTTIEQRAVELVDELQDDRAFEVLVQRAVAALEAARADALEEAARECEAEAMRLEVEASVEDRAVAEECARRIRAMKSGGA